MSGMDLKVPATEEQSSWHRNTHTLACLKSAQKQRASALETLIMTARGSSDLRVLQAYAVYEHFEAVIDMLTPGKDDES